MRHSTNSKKIPNVSVLVGLLYNDFWLLCFVYLFLRVLFTDSYFTSFFAWWLFQRLDLECFFLHGVLINDVSVYSLWDDFIRVLSSSIYCIDFCIIMSIGSLKEWVNCLMIILFKLAGCMMIFVGSPSGVSCVEVCQMIFLFL